MDLVGLHKDHEPSPTAQFFQIPLLSGYDSLNEASKIFCLLPDSVYSRTKTWLPVALFCAAKAFPFRIPRSPMGGLKSKWLHLKPWRAQGLICVTDQAGLDFSLDKPLSEPIRKLGKILSYACPYIRGKQNRGHQDQDYEHLSLRELSKLCSTSFMEPTELVYPWVWLLRLFPLVQIFTLFPFFIPGIPL